MDDSGIAVNMDTELEHDSSYSFDNIVEANVPVNNNQVKYEQQAVDDDFIGQFDKVDISTSDNNDPNPYPPSYQNTPWENNRENKDNLDMSASDQDEVASKSSRSSIVESFAKDTKETDDIDTRNVEKGKSVPLAQLRRVSQLVSRLEEAMPRSSESTRTATTHEAKFESGTKKFTPSSKISTPKYRPGSHEVEGIQLMSQVHYVMGAEGGTEQGSDQTQTESSSNRSYLGHRTNDSSDENSESFDTETKKLKVKIGPEEQDMLAYRSLGVDYSKKNFERGGSTESGPRSPRTPSKWDPDPNRPRPPIVNHQTVEKLPPPEITRNVRDRFEKGDIPDVHEVQKINISLYETEDAGVESKPIVREGVTRETDTVNDMEVLERGKTEGIASKWSEISADKPIEKFTIKLAEDEGCILETDPEQRTDVYRESDQHENNYLPDRGHSASLRDKFINRQEKQVERKPINLYEGAETNPTVIENEPAPPLQEVVNNMQEQEVTVKKGKIRNMATYFANKTDEPTERGPIELCREEDGIILENVPIKRDNVIRECDEVNNSVQIERGNASSLKSRFENQREEYESKGFQMDVEMTGPTVLENEPLQRDDVIREDHQVEEVIPGEAGRARKLADKFLNVDHTPKIQREAIVIERSEAPSVLENQPIERTDVVKCDVDYRRDDPILSAGSTANKVGYWLNRTDEVNVESEEEKRNRIQSEIEAARAQAGVYENEPEENPEFEYQEEEAPQLPSGHSKNMRSRWYQMQEEEERRRQREECPEIVRFTPPRELTPPPLRQNDTVQSYQTFTIGGGSSGGGSVGVGVKAQPEPAQEETYDETAFETSFNITQNGVGNGYEDYNSFQEETIPTGEVQTSSTKISLRQIVEDLC